MFPSLRSIVPGLALLALVPVLPAQEIVLKNGRSLPAASVKPEGSRFVAEIGQPGLMQKVPFAPSDIARVDFPEPAVFPEVRALIAAKAELTEIEPKLKEVMAQFQPYRNVPGSYWGSAMLLRMAAMAARGGAGEAANLITEMELEALPVEQRSAITDFRQLLAIGDLPPAEQPAKLKEIAKTSLNGWVAAAAWLRLGDLLAGRGKMEEALMAWLQVPVFHSTEQDQVAQATLSAAKALQELNRTEDAVKFVEDHLAEMEGTPFQQALKAELVRLSPNAAKP